MNIRFGKCNVRNMYRQSSLMTVSKDLSRSKLDLVGVQEVKWDGNSTRPAGEYTFVVERGMRATS
jgi:hypothetical protein